MNIFDYLNINGHVTVHKVFDNGEEELIYDDHNVIVSGMGVGLSCFFGLSGSDSVLDYQIDRFQLGISGGSVNEVSSTNQLSAPLSSASEYIGLNGEIETASANQFAGSLITQTRWFGLIPTHNITRINEKSVRYTIIVDKDSCNNLTRNGQPVYLNELGLFMKNPLDRYPIIAPILVAYKVISNIRKTSDFGLIFRWTINF